MTAQTNLILECLGCHCFCIIQLVDGLSYYIYKKRVLIVFEVFYTVLYCMYVIVKCIVENNQVFQYIFSLFYAVLPCTAIYCTVLDFGWTPKLFKAKQEGKTTAGFCLSRHFTNKKKSRLKSVCGILKYV